MTMIAFRIFLGTAFLLSTAATLAYMYALHQCAIVKLADFKPDHPKVGPAIKFVTYHGGIERVERCSKAGIEIFAPLTIPSLILLILSLTHFSPLP